MEKRILFMGSPEFAVPALKKINSNYEVLAVVTQPDRPSGRGGKIEISPVKDTAISLGLKVFQPEKIKSTESISWISSLSPDLIVVAAFGQILSKQILEIPLFGCINVHASLLPKFRGASPIQSAILAGDKETGVSIMVMDEGLDTGPILSQKELPIDPEENSLTLSNKLSIAGADLLLDTLEKFFTGQLHSVKQREDKATLTRLIKKHDGLMDFKNSSEYLERMVRAFYPWPGAHFFWKNSLIKVIKGHINKSQDTFSGEHKIIEKKPAIGAGDGFLIIDLLQPSGKRILKGEEFLNGARDWLIS